MTPDAAYTNTTCPCCNSTEVHHFCESRGYRILKCARCGFGFVENVPAEQELVSGYRSSYLTGGIFRPKTSLTRKLRYWLLSKHIHRLLPHRKRIDLLDIGCAQGDLLQIVKGNDRFAAIGIDYATGPVEYARARGLDVHQSSLHDMHFPPERFDCIVANHVIEHVHDLDQTFSEITRVLKHGGYFLAVVPCFSHVKALISGEEWKYICPPAHLWYFSVRSFELLLLRYGFTIVRSTNWYRKAHMKIIAAKT